MHSKHLIQNLPKPFSTTQKNILKLLNKRKQTQTNVIHIFSHIQKKITTNRAKWLPKITNLQKILGPDYHIHTTANELVDTLAKKARKLPPFSLRETATSW